jgi:hypothetical protein
MLKTLPVAFSFFFSILQDGHAQKLLTWEQLEDVKFAKTFSGLLVLVILV